ncbi:hypothetical protein B0H19DRAFT_1057746 [Mycena capillaripes]|nr:hypothetical protein B0H19DRAFT_1057746 [Mycena capillaripes]
MIHCFKLQLIVWLFSAVLALGPSLALEVEVQSGNDISSDLNWSHSFPRINFRQWKTGLDLAKAFFLTFARFYLAGLFWGRSKSDSSAIAHRRIFLSSRPQIPAGASNLASAQLFPNRVQSLAAEDATHRTTLFPVIVTPETTHYSQALRSWRI